MNRLLEEAQREFPHWQFRRAGESWAAVRGDIERTAATIAELRAGLRTEAPGWRVWRSDAGRWWATREQPYDEVAEKAGAWRTVDADDELSLARAIAEQESIADLASAS
ncbi:hypothetical protein ABZT47_34515 [Sphaerisporangium sp. NPDC005289]|uniref:hypothetical protein n=1 Tax=Sphaerisporangium sp. NPDC005289 TaxID=3155247 RepID=UPI0033BED253